MPSDQGKVKKTLSVDILDDIDDKNVHEAARSKISPTHLAGMLRPLAEEQFALLDEGCAKIREAEEKFFNGRLSFSSRFGLIVFPFFTFFDSIMECFRMDLLRSLRYPSIGTLVSLGLFAQKDISRKVTTAFQKFSAAMKTQLSGMEHEGAEPFISRLSEFLQLIDQMPVLCQKARLEKDIFLFKIKDAHRQLFFSEGEQWEDTAVTAMGDVLGRMAQTAMPTEQTFVLALKRLNGVAAKKQLEKFISLQRSTFQENLVHLCKPVYEDTVDSITAAWKTYKTEYELRAGRLRRFLENFPAKV